MKHSYIDTCFPVHIVKLNCDCRFHSLCLNLELSLIVTGYIKKYKKGHNSFNLWQGLMKFMSCTSTHYKDHVKQVSFRWLENCLSHNISPTDQQFLPDRLHVLTPEHPPPTIISLVGGIIKYLQQRGLCN